MKVKDINSYIKNPKKMINGLFVLFCLGFLLIVLSKDFFGNNDEMVNEGEVEVPVMSHSVDTNGEVGLASYADELEEKLEEEFSKISGAGKVEVVILLRTKGEIVVNKDRPVSGSQTLEDDGQGGTRENSDSENLETTVILNNDNGAEEPIIIKEYYPEITGILIIAEGGDQAEVKNNLINASKVLLDLPVNKIEVMKMSK